MAEPIEILLIEDNRTDIELILHALAKHQLTNRVLVLRDGEQAIEYLLRADAEIPKVIVLDLKLPKANGLEVLRRIKAHPRTRTIPVVVLTSSREERDLAESYALGANSYIVKPVDFQQFAEIVQHLGLYWLRHNQPPL